MIKGRERHGFLSEFGISIKNFTVFFLAEGLFLPEKIKLFMRCVCRAIMFRPNSADENGGVLFWNMNEKGRGALAGDPL